MIDCWSWTFCLLCSGALLLGYLLAWFVLKKWKSSFLDLKEVHERSKGEFLDQVDDNKKLKLKFADLEKSQESARVSLADWKKRHREAEEEFSLMKNSKEEFEKKCKALDIALAEVSDQLKIAKEEAEQRKPQHRLDNSSDKQSELAKVDLQKPELLPVEDSNGVINTESIPEAGLIPSKEQEPKELLAESMGNGKLSEQSVSKQESTVNEDSFKALEAEKAAVDELLISRQSEISSLSSRLALMMHERNELKKKWDSALSSGAKIRSDLKSYVVAKDESVEKLKKNRVDLRDELLAWKEKHRSISEIQKEQEIQLLALKADQIAKKKSIKAWRNKDLLHQSNLEKMHRQINRLYVDSEKQERKLFDKRVELETLKSHLEDRQVKTETLEFEISDQLKKYRSLQADLSVERKLLSEERDQVEELSQVKEENEKLKNRLDKWKDDLNSQKAISRESQEKIEQLQKELDKKNEELNVGIKELSSLQHQFEVENRNFGLANIDVNNWKLRFKKKSDETDRLEKLSKSLQQKADKLSKKEARLDRALSELKEKLKPLEKGHTELLAAANQQEAEKKKLENQLKKTIGWKERHEPELRELKVKLKESDKLSRAIKQELEKQSKTLAAENKKLLNENTRLESELGKISGLLEKLENLVKAVPAIKNSANPKAKSKAEKPKPIRPIRPIRPKSNTPKPVSKLNPKEQAKKEALQRVRKWRSKIDFDRLGKVRARQKVDLKVIKGIGPFIEEKLNMLGIYRLEQIAKITKKDEAIIDQAIETFPGRISRENWVKQAKALIRGID